MLLFPRKVYTRLLHPREITKKVQFCLKGFCGAKFFTIFLLFENYVNKVKRGMIFHGGLIDLQ